MHAGFDTYGRVKSVGETPIVTRFFMLGGLPIYPLQSFYSLGPSRAEISGVPFVGGWQSVSTNGLPLAHVDRLSVGMAYARGLFGAMTVLGCMSIIPIAIFLTGEHMDELAMIIMRSLIAILLVGVVGGLGTYLLPLTPRREQQIRTYAGEVLGICADPAKLHTETALAIGEFAMQAERETIGPGSRSAFVCQLILCRVKLAQATDDRAIERRTDELLDRLDQIARLPG